MVTLFERLEHLCEGAIAIDRGGRVIYVNEKYLASLGLKHTTEAIGRPIEEIIPNSLMRSVAESGEPILLDIMELGGEQLVVTRMPIEDEDRNVIGAIGFVLYDHLESLEAAARPRHPARERSAAGAAAIVQRARGALHPCRFRRHDGGDRAGQGVRQARARGRA